MSNKILLCVMVFQLALFCGILMAWDDLRIEYNEDQKTLSVLLNIHKDIEKRFNDVNGKIRILNKAIGYGKRNEDETENEKLIRSML